MSFSLTMSQSQVAKEGLLSSARRLQTEGKHREAGMILQVANGMSAEALQIVCQAMMLSLLVHDIVDEKRAS